MSVARAQCLSSTLDLPFFFDSGHLDLAAQTRHLAIHVFSPAEERLAREPQLSFEKLSARCRDIARRLGDARLLDVVVPARLGGLAIGNPNAVDTRSVCLVRETLAWASPLAEFVFAMQGLGSYPIVLAGTPDQQREFLGPVLSGQSLAAFAITEPNAGSDVASMTSRAQRADDGYVLHGSKTFISNAGMAGHYVVFARTSPGPGSKGISAFIVRPEDKGFVFEGPVELIADHPVGTIRFDGIRLPPSRRIGAEGDGFRLAMATLDAFRSTVGAAAAGMARRAVDEALMRVTTRKQFGEVLADFQTTKFYLAEMATELDAARMLIYRAAYMRDHGADRVTLEASMAKMFATESAQRIIDRALQLHGGSGLIRGHVLERLYREVRALRIYEGTTEIQRLVIAGVLIGGERARVNELQTAEAAQANEPTNPLGVSRPSSADSTRKFKSLKAPKKH